MTPEEIKKGETDKIEFKREVPKKDSRYLKTVVAFANGAGGSLVFGIDDGTLEVVGVPDDGIRQLEDGLASAISAACTPSIVPAFSRETVDGKTILVVDIYPGRCTPYHIKAEGLGGVYVRVGATTRKAEREQVEDLILRGSNRTYDAVIRENETASEAAMKKLCRRISAAHGENTGQRVKVTPAMLEGWGVVRKIGGKWHPSVAFRWLSANNDHFARVQCAVFADDERTEFIDRQEFSGSLIDQIEETFKFVLRSIRRGAKIEGLYRKDSYELPPEALREAIVNAIAHRDYRQHGYVQVSVLPGSVEVVSPGTLYDGLTQDEMLAGKSKLRNPVLADVFHKMGIIEKWGTGLPRIFARCAKAGVPAPRIAVGGSTVSILFPRKGSATQETERTTREMSKTAQEIQQTTQETSVSTQETSQSPTEKILVALRDNPELTLAELARQLGMSRDGVKYHVNILKKTLGLRHEGPTKKGRWSLPDGK